MEIKLVCRDASVRIKNVEFFDIQGDIAYITLNKEYNATIVAEHGWVYRCTPCYIEYRLASVDDIVILECATNELTHHHNDNTLESIKAVIE